MVDYEKIYVQVMHHLKDSELCEGMSESAIQAEQIMEIVKKNVEEDLNDGSQ